MDAEARAIRWAVDNGARVINMSLGGIRDPLDPDRDTYSRLEADAVAYAISNGVVVVAAVGNSDQAPASPWKYASYPGGTAARARCERDERHGRHPDVLESRPDLQRSCGARPRDPLDPAAAADCSLPGLLGAGVLELRTRTSTERRRGRRSPRPQVTAAAAVLLSLRPTLRPEQVTQILESTTIDLNAATGCEACGDGSRRVLRVGGGSTSQPRSPRWPRISPSTDSFETNDDVGTRAHGVSGDNRRLRASVDFWDDQDDVYAIHLGRKQPVYVGLTGVDPSVDLSLAFWLPQTRSIERVSDFRLRVRTSTRAGSRQYLSYRPRLAGTYFVQVRISSPGATRYRLAIIKG